MMNKFIVAAVVAITGSFAMAKTVAPEFKGALVLRVDKRDNSVSMASTEGKLATKDDAKAFAKNTKFAALPKDKVQRSELDQETGSSSWYWYYGGYNYNYLNWYGQYYQPFYTYNYSYYNYYYYTGWNYNYGWNNGGCWYGCWRFNF